LGVARHARVCEQKKCSETAAAIYRHLATIDKLPIDLLEPLASGLGGCGEYELALNVCRQAAQRMPDIADTLLGIVHYLRRLRRPLEVALPAMYRAYQLEPDNVEYRIALAWMLYELDRTVEGARLLESVPLAQFSCARCLERMQAIFERSGQCERAELCRERLVELASESSARHEDRERGE
jgi:hypothetical protein